MARKKSDGPWVVKSGQDWSAVVFAAECGGCGCVWKFCERHLRPAGSHFRDGEWHGGSRFGPSVIACPECNKTRRHIRSQAWIVG